MIAEPDQGPISPAAPLAGITVLGLQQAIAGTLCTRHLADLGARVIKIEQPGGGDMARHYDDVVRGMGAHFVWLNHGKQSAALDLTEPADLDVFTALLERADVVVSNLAPGALGRLGLAPGVLAERYPRHLRLRPGRPAAAAPGAGPRLDPRQRHCARPRRRHRRHPRRGQPAAPGLSAGWRRPQPGLLLHTDRWAGSRALVTTLARSSWTESRSTVSFSRTANAVTIWSAS